MCKGQRLVLRDIGEGRKKQTQCSQCLGIGQVHDPNAAEIYKAAVADVERCEQELAGARLRLETAAEAVKRE
jgi:hypothetical protein